MLWLLLAEEDGDIHVCLLGEELGVAYGALIRVHAQDARYDGRVRAVAPAGLRERAEQSHTGGSDLAVHKTVGHLTDAYRSGGVGAGWADHPRPDDVKQTDAHGFPFLKTDPFL